MIIDEILQITDVACMPLLRLGKCLKDNFDKLMKINFN